MKYKKVIITIAVLNFVFSAGMFSVQARSVRNLENEQEDEQRAELIMESIENNNYESWRKLLGSNTQIAKIIGPKEFDDFVKIRNLARQTKYKEAMDIYKGLKSRLNLSNNEINKIAQLIEKEVF